MKRIYVEWSDNLGRRRNGNIVGDSVKVYTFASGAEPEFVDVELLTKAEMRS